MWKAIDLWLGSVAQIIDFIGIAILLWGVLRSIVQGFYEEGRFLSWLSNIFAIQKVRLELGGYILLTLEFLIVADIIRSVTKRTMDDLVILTILVIIRTAISFFLGRELEEATARRKEKSK